MTLKKVLEAYKHIYMPYMNLAERTREEYLNDHEDLVASLAISGIRKVGSYHFHKLKDTWQTSKTGDLQGQPGNEKR